MTKPVFRVSTYANISLLKNYLYRVTDYIKGLAKN